jgi:putative transposase
MGARWVATCAFLSDRTIIFYGEEVNRIREHTSSWESPSGKRTPDTGSRSWGVSVTRKYGRWTTVFTGLLARSWKRLKNGTRSSSWATSVGFARTRTKNGMSTTGPTRCCSPGLLNYIEYKARDAGID